MYLIRPAIMFVTALWWIGAAVLSPASALSTETRTLLQKGGYVILMRHAQTTGTGDPSGFKPGDCATQRNLNDAGRAQARTQGGQFSDAGVVMSRVVSSPWCRCTETASLIAPKVPVESLSELGSYIKVDAAAQTAMTAQIRREIEAWRGPGNLLIVSHQVNIDAITDRTISQGAYLVIDPKGRRVLAEDR